VREKGDEEMATNAGYNTFLTVLAKDGTLRDVAVCASDSAETIGANVIAAINGTRLFQMSTLKCDACRGYASVGGDQRLPRWARSAV
jgi:hypothetical protein